MPLNIRSEDVNRLTEALAARTRKTKTEALKQALQNEMRQLDETVPVRERVHGRYHGQRGGGGTECVSRYGKGRGHPAQLNLGDCFAYEMAKNHKTALLFKGQDFSRQISRQREFKTMKSRSSGHPRAGHAELLWSSRRRYLARSHRRTRQG